MASSAQRCRVGGNSTNEHSEPDPNPIEVNGTPPSEWVQTAVQDFNTLVCQSQPELSPYCKMLEFAVKEHFHLRVCYQELSASFPRDDLLLLSSTVSDSGTSNLQLC
ncbi:hypothetical protein UY3_05385 [Chelonia mydas]|uniref:Uncharacterized protein n=1 Tax=Chelonia mydas TaxID=8469 RepID=M7BJN9_CHEMY|nr:hypothetical protein UY3_05385 [Chelonia mydas]